MLFCDHCRLLPGLWFRAESEMFGSSMNADRHREQTRTWAMPHPLWQVDDGGWVSGWMDGGRDRWVEGGMMGDRCEN